jgi:hypothetical protein
MDLSQEFQEAAASYDKCLARVSSSAKKEVWTTGPYYNIDPFDFERMGFKRGVILKKSPTSTKNKYYYIFDDKDNLLCVRQYLDIAGQFNEEFVFSEDGFLKSYLYSNNKSIINVKNRIIDNHLVIELFLKGKRGSKHESYHYENDQLVTIRVEQWNDNQQGISYNCVLKYKNSELIEINNEFDNGYAEKKYPIK